MSVELKAYIDSQDKALGREIGEVRRESSDDVSLLRQDIADLRTDVRSLKDTVTRWAGGLAVIVVIALAILARLIDRVGF